MSCLCRNQRKMQDRKNHYKRSSTGLLRSTHTAARFQTAFSLASQTPQPASRSRSLVADLTVLHDTCKTGAQRHATVSRYSPDRSPAYSTSGTGPREENSTSSLSPCGRSAKSSLILRMRNRKDCWRLELS